MLGCCCGWCLCGGWSMVSHFFLTMSSQNYPQIFQSIPSIRVFANESFLRIWWPKYWSFSISPSNEYSGLISFKTDWFDRYVTALLRSHQGCQVQFRTSRWNVGMLWRCCSGQGPHIAMTRETRGFSRVETGFSSYNREFRLPLQLAQGWGAVPSLRELSP